MIGPDIARFDYGGGGKERSSNPALFLPTTFFGGYFSFSFQ